MKTFRDLRERFHRGVSVRYHTNPSASDMYSFLMNTSFKGIRLWTYDGDLYMWDAGSTTHTSFVQDEMPQLMGFETYRLVSDENCGHFYLDDRYSSHFGNNILKNHKRTIDMFFDIVRGEYDIEIVNARNTSRVDYMLHKKE